LNDIFRPFYRVEDARDRKTGGTGLGLAIATRAIGLHGGSITATNAVDGGLQVEIRISAGRFSQFISVVSKNTANDANQCSPA
jgi:two-component system sensor histidine kinase CpxA